MKTRISRLSKIAVIALASCLAGTFALVRAQQRPVAEVAIGSSDVGGRVTSRNGPEAGVWVIAETTDLPTKFAKMVVTDERGRYVIPELPKANYKVWVRGYGLVDSQKLNTTPGRHLNLAAVPAPTSAAAAEYYPGVYWYSMLRIPDKSQFPGTGPNGNGISTIMKTQQDWIDSIKNSCQSCHALGSQGVRRIPAAWGHFDNSIDAWTKRTQAGQAQANMATTLGQLGRKEAIALFADWTDRIAAGELPSAKPQRPQGVERNIVISMWEWSTPKAYLHDEISTDKRNPSLNANGLIYGSPEESTEMVPVLNPMTNETWQIKHPYRDPNTPSSLDYSHGHSVYWGDEPIWDGHTTIHNPNFDDQGRVWFTARIRAAENPAYCKAGSDLPSAKVAPLEQSVRQLSMYDPKTGKFSLIDTCFSTQHLYFGHDANNTLWTSAGGPESGVVGWLNTGKQYVSETGGMGRSVRADRRKIRRCRRAGASADVRDRWKNGVASAARTRGVAIGNDARCRCEDRREGIGPGPRGACIATASAYRAAARPRIYGIRAHRCIRRTRGSCWWRAPMCRRECRRSSSGYRRRMSRRRYGRS